MRYARLLIFLSAVFFIVSWILPNHYYPWSTAYQDFVSFFAGLLLLLAVFVARTCVVPRSYILLLLLPLIPLLQYLMGVMYFSGDAWVVALYLAGFVLMVFAGYNFGVNSVLREYVTALMAGAFIVASVLSVYIALVQWCVLSGSIWVVDMPSGGRPFANLAQPNNLATLLCMGLAGVIYFYEKFYLGRLVSGCLAFFLLFGVVLAQSRTPWVSALVLIVFWTAKFSKHSVRLSSAGMFGWVSIYFVGVLILPLLAEIFLLSVANPMERAQSIERWELWGQLWHAAWLQTWGYGWNQVSIAQVAAALAYPVPILTEHSHNIILDLLIWNGPIVGGVIVSFVSFWIVRLVWAARAIESIFALLAVGFVLVHAMFEFPLDYAFFLLPVGLLLGLCSAEHPSRFELSFPRWILLGFIFLGGFLYVSIWREYRVIEESHRLMRFENSGFAYVRSESVAPDVILLTQLREFIGFARAQAVVGMSEAQLERMRKVAYRYPYVSSIFRYSLALALNDQSRAAVKQMLILRSLHGDVLYFDGVRSFQELSAVYPQLLVVLQNLPRIANHHDIAD